MGFYGLSRRPDVGQTTRVSFEFFPPKTEEMEQRLWDTVTRLAPLQPDFVSVTYGAGGSTRERTIRTVARILKETDIKPAAHLTCVDATREDVDRVAREFAALGVNRFVALRGDPASGIGEKICADAGRLSKCGRTGWWIAQYCGFRHFGFRLSGKAPGKPGFRD